MQQYQQSQQQQNSQIQQNPQNSPVSPQFYPLNKRNIALLAGQGKTLHYGQELDQNDKFFSKSSIITFNNHNSKEGQKDYLIPNQLKLQKSGSTQLFTNQIISPVPIKTPLFAKFGQCNNFHGENSSQQCDFSDAQTEYSLNLSPENINEIQRLRQEENNKPEPGFDIFSIEEDSQIQGELDDEIYRMMEQFQCSDQKQQQEPIMC